MLTRQAANLVKHEKLNRHDNPDKLAKPDIPDKSNLSEKHEVCGVTLFLVLVQLQNPFLKVVNCLRDQCFYLVSPKSTAAFCNHKMILCQSYSYADASRASSHGGPRLSRAAGLCIVLQAALLPQTNYFKYTMPLLFVFEEDGGLIKNSS